MQELQKFNEVQMEISKAIVPIMAMKVSDRDNASAASAARRSLKKYEDEIKKKLKELIEPHELHIKRLKEFAKQISEPIDAAEGHLKNQLLLFEMQLQKEREELMKKEREERTKREEEARKVIEANRIEAEAKAKALKEEAEVLAMFAEPEEIAVASKEAESAAQNVIAEAEAEARRVSFEAQKAGWDAKKEITSIKVDGARRTWKWRVVDESIIPDDYKLKILDENRIKMALKDKRPIPGIEYYQELSVTR